MTNLQQTQIDDYISQVGNFLPFDKLEKTQVLKELKLEVIEAMETQPGIIDQVFGSPRQTAINLVQTNAPQFNRASWISRLLAYSIDSLIIGTLLMIIYGIPYLFLMNIYDFEKSPETGWEFFIVIVYSIYGLIMFAICLSLYFVPEKLYAQTPGKKMLGLKVLDEQGIKISWKQAISRNLVKYQPEFFWIDFLIGILMSEGTISKATDLVSKTMVVKR